MMQMVLLEEIIGVVTEHVMVMMVFNLLKPYMWIMLQTILLTVRLHSHIEVSGYYFNFFKCTFILIFYKFYFHLLLLILIDNCVESSPESLSTRSQITI